MAPTRPTAGRRSSPPPGFPAIDRLVTAIANADDIHPLPWKHRTDAEDNDASLGVYDRDGHPVTTESSPACDLLAAAAAARGALVRVLAERDEMRVVLARLLVQLVEHPYPDTNPIWLFLQRDAIAFFPLGNYRAVCEERPT